MSTQHPVAHEILEATKYASFASVTNEGLPENVPLSFAYDDKALYFRSPAGTHHKKNSSQQPCVAVVVMDTTQHVKGALYISSFVTWLDGDAEANARGLLDSRLGAVPSFWGDVDYFSVELGALDEQRTIDRMLYFKKEVSHES